MELQAAIDGLRSLGEPEVPAVVISDSQYLVNGMAELLPGWKARGWRKSNKKAVLNVDLWQTLEGLADTRPVSWEWVRGHDGHALNEVADMLANNAAKGVYGDDPEKLKTMHPHLFV